MTSLLAMAFVLFVGAAMVGYALGRWSGEAEVD